MTSQIHRTDLHYHGPIGFEPYWLRVQGYKGKNLLKLIADACFKRDLTICALTSETDQVDENGLIPRNSIHDRIGYLVEKYLAGLNSIQGYKADRFGPNSITVEHNERTLCLINGQTPIIMERDRRYDHLIIGSNQVPNFRNFRDTLKYCNDNGLAHGFEHPELETHFGIGAEKAKEYVDLCDFVEGHNAQLSIREGFSKLPILGKYVRDYTRANNERAKEFAKKHKKPYIATSDGHMIESAGRAYIEIKKDELNLGDEQRMLQTLREIIRANSFTTYEGYEHIINFIEWTIKFKFGLRRNRYKRI